MPSLNFFRAGRCLGYAQSVGQGGAWRWLACVPVLVVALIASKQATEIQPVGGWRDGVGPTTPKTAEIAAMQAKPDRPVLASVRAAPGPVMAPAPVVAKPARPTALEAELSADVLVPAPPQPAGREVFSGPTHGARIALTFDDGPSAELTPTILATLKRYDVRATFFVLGHRAQGNSDLLATIDAQGHEVGNHGWSHTSLRTLFPGQIKQELDDTNAVIREATGKTPALFRPPFGRYPDSAVELVAARGMNLVLWNADGRDWEGDVDAIVTRVLHQARPGAIILLHDREAATVRALPRILNGLRRKGLQPVPVSELTGLPATVTAAG